VDQSDAEIAYVTPPSRALSRSRPFQLITTSEKERMLRSSMKSSRFLVYSVAPMDRALNANKQSFTKPGSLALRSDRTRRTWASIAPASFSLWLRPIGLAFAAAHSTDCDRELQPDRLVRMAGIMYRFIV
jgi:hypothetical protein